MTVKRSRKTEYTGTPEQKERNRVKALRYCRRKRAEALGITVEELPPVRVRRNLAALPPEPSPTPAQARTLAVSAFRFRKYMAGYRPAEAVVADSGFFVKGGI